MTVGDWLRSRTPRAPAALAARIEVVLGKSLEEPASRAPALFLEAGERLAADLLGKRSTSRESALDLLAADALVTYAFEDAGESPTAIEARAAGSMTRIANLTVGGN